MGCGIMEREKEIEKVRKFVGKCSICDYETEVMDEESDADFEISEHITDRHVDDYIEMNTEINEIDDEE